MRFVFLILLFSVLLASGAEAQPQKYDNNKAVGCEQWFKDVSEWIDPYNPIAFHLAMAKSRGDSGHFTVAEGFIIGDHSGIYGFPFPNSDYVTDEHFDPGIDWPDEFEGVPAYVLESLIQRWRETGKKIYGPKSVKTSRRDDIGFKISDRGTGRLTLHSWGDTELELTNMLCAKDLHGFYLTALAHEGNGTRTVGLTIHSPYRFEVESIKRR